MKGFQESACSCHWLCDAGAERGPRIGTHELLEDAPIASGSQETRELPPGHKARGSFAAEGLIALPGPPPNPFLPVPFLHVKGSW